MKPRQIYYTLFLIMVFQMSNGQTPILDKNTNEEIIKAMTLDEKTRLVVGMGMRIPGMDETQTQGPVVGKTEEKVPGAAGTTASIDRLGIHTMVLADGPAGLRISPTREGTDRTFYATAFPIASLLASSWDTDLVQQVGKAMGSEVRAYGADILLAPGMNIQRNALGGRNFEYYSEDPLLTGKMAAAMVRGVQSNGVGTSVKHFAANSHEFNRNQMNVKVGQRALREIYLRGFEIAIKESSPWTVMSSYNKVNGTYTSESGDLLTKILREDWGFEGFVMTDWFGGKDAVAQMEAGNDLLMPGTPMQLETLRTAVKNGTMKEKVLDENIDRILDIMRLTPAAKGQSPTNEPDLERNAIIARKAAAESMVLLKNDGGTLPMQKGITVSAFGNHTYDLVSGGTGSGDVNEAYTVSLPDGLHDAGISVNRELMSAYEKHISTQKDMLPKDRPWFLAPPPLPEMAFDEDGVKEYVENDMAIITLGRIAGEFADRKTENDFYLSDAEQQLIEKVSSAFHSAGKKVVVIINSGGVIETASWRDKVDAILLAWLPGQEAGNAIADVLSGRVNPSGKITVTFPVKFEDDPTAEGFPGNAYGEIIEMGPFTARESEVIYDEGIFVGYRAFDKENIEPAYPFGFGLSYTDFEYTLLEKKNPVFNGQFSVGVTVKNVGDLPGKEIVQLYLTPPKSQLVKPIRELKSFAKTRLLQPGESQELTFTLDSRALASFYEDHSSWIVDPGVYRAQVGASSRDFEWLIDFTVPERIVVETVSNALPMN